MKVYLFGWPGTLGGAATKFAHLLRLLKDHYPLTVITPDPAQLADKESIRWMESQGIRYGAIDDLPRRLQGWGVTLCNSEFLGSQDWVEVRKRGLKMAWGNEMMWPLPQETGALTFGQIDAVLYVSKVQRAALEPEYTRKLRGSLVADSPSALAHRRSGWIEGATPRERLRWVNVGNYIDPQAFPFHDRSRDSGRPFTIGRLSRADPTKFPDDFPQSYESLGLEQARFRVMAWDRRMAACWAGHSFDERWELLKFSPDTAGFLQSLDLFVYEVGPRCRESWGRAVVEAMLTGAIPLVPRGGGHHLDQLVEHRKSGFLCKDRSEFSRYARYLQDHPNLRMRMSRACRQNAVRRLCNRRQHLLAWRELFHGR